MVAAALVVKIWGGNVWKQFGSSEMGAETCAHLFAVRNGGRMCAHLLAVLKWGHKRARTCWQ